MNESEQIKEIRAIAQKQAELLGLDYPLKDANGCAYYPPRHICQRCKKILGAIDLLDYWCNECSKRA